jgi:SAM-dependent methyltransferase
MSLSPSFRDPHGCCFAFGGRILRTVNAEGLAALESFLTTKAARQFLDWGNLVPSRRLGAAEVQELKSHATLDRFLGAGKVAAIFEHERVPFASYATEWPAEMLDTAATLTLDLAEHCLAEGWGLKDATPHNVLFHGGKPVFIDLLSFERRRPGDALWRPHAQFCRTFLLPLLSHKHWGLRPNEVFATHRDGLEPAEVYRLCGPVRRWLPPFLTQATLPTWLGRRGGDAATYRERLLPDAEKAQFILQSLFRGLRRTLKRARPSAAQATTWSDYMESHSYSDANFVAKEDFVRQALRERPSRHVLDIGANTGHFSQLAAESGASVVAIDLDAGCVGRLWQRAQARRLDILPLVVDLARPSPAQGWRNRECRSFLERATGGFDAVLMLAVLHHLLVTKRIPLLEVLDQAAELTTGTLVIEYVGPQDPMFQALTRGREHLHADFNQAVFEQACGRRFRILRQTRLPGAERALYFCERRAG